MIVRRIVVLNPKGGSGKTTLATNLAAFYAAENRPVGLMDYDSQGSSSRWLSRRDPELPDIHGISAFESPAGQTRAFAHRLPSGVERLVVDTPAAFRKHELMDYVRGADRILVPVLPSEIDIHAATRTIADLLLTGRVDRSQNRLAVVANRVKRNTVVFRSLMKFLESLEIPVAAVLRDSQNYIRAAAEGRGVAELKKSDTARDVAQWKRLVSWLEGDRPWQTASASVANLPEAANTTASADRPWRLQVRAR